MSESTNSQSDTKTEPTPEMPADLSQNLDEVNDVQLAMATLGGLRATTANDAAERSHRRYDDRMHRWHETRTKEKFGVESSAENKQSEGEASEGEVGHQVWVRSPVEHHYHGEMPQGGPSPPRPPQGVSPLAAALLGGAIALGGYWLLNGGSPDRDTITNIIPGFGDPDTVQP